MRGADALAPRSALPVQNPFLIKNKEEALERAKVCGAYTHKYACMCVYVHVFMCKHICMYLCGGTYTCAPWCCTCVHVCVPSCKYMYIHTYMYMYMYTHTHKEALERAKVCAACMHMYKCAYVYPHINTCIYAHMHSICTHIRARTHTRTHTHTHAHTSCPSLSSLCPLPPFCTPTRTHSGKPIRTSATPYAGPRPNVIRRKLVPYH